MKYLILLALVTGCNIPLHASDVEKAQEVCKDHKGLDRVYISDWDDSIEARCVNGVKITFEGAR